MSFKLREGFFRVVENNVCVGPCTPGFHAWFEGAEDMICRNIIVSTEGTDIYEFHFADPSYARQFDYNLFYNYRGEPTVLGINIGSRTFRQWQVMGFDRHSVFADPLFMDPDNGDYRVKPESPALKLGFKNFDMKSFGVIKPAFRVEARAGHEKFDRAENYEPLLLPGEDKERRPDRRSWLGAEIKNLTGEAEKSAVGLGSETGVLFVDVPADSEAAKIGFRKADVILECAGNPVFSVSDLMEIVEGKGDKSIPVVLYRDQQKTTLTLL